jgi:hypothetical protein
MQVAAALKKEIEDIQKNVAAAEEVLRGRQLDKQKAKEEFEKSLRQLQTREADLKKRLKDETVKIKIAKEKNIDLGSKKEANSALLREKAAKLASLDIVQLGDPENTSSSNTADVDETTDDTADPSAFSQGSFVVKKLKVLQAINVFDGSLSDRIAHIIDGGEIVEVLIDHREDTPNDRRLRLVGTDDLWISQQADDGTSLLEPYDERAEVAAKVRKLQEDIEAINVSFSDNLNIISDAEKSVASYNADLRPVVDQIDELSKDWREKSFELETLIEDASEAIRNIVETSLKPKHREESQTASLLAELRMASKRTDEKRLHLIDSIASLLQPFQRDQKCVQSPLVHDDRCAYASFFLQYPNVHATITAIIILSQYIVVDGRTNLISFAESSSLCCKLSGAFKADIETYIARDLPSWNSTWLQKHAQDILSATLDVSYSNVPLESPERLSSEERRKVAPDPEGKKFSSSNWSKQSIASYLSKSKTAMTSWSTSVANAPNDDDQTVIDEETVKTVLRNFVSMCRTVTEADQLRELFSKVINALRVDQIATISIASGLVLDNILEIPEVGVPRFMQYYIADDAERELLQWAVANKYDPDAKQPNVHENYALSQQFKQRPYWMELKHYLTYTSLLSDPLTFLSKLPLIFSYSPIMLPLAQDAVHVLIRQGLYILGPHRDLPDSSLEIKVEENLPSRVNKSDLFNFEFMQALSKAIQDYAKAMSGLSTEHEV